jgi:hypothetical protein
LFQVLAIGERCIIADDLLLIQHQQRGEIQLADGAR